MQIKENHERDIEKKLIEIGIGLVAIKDWNLLLKKIVQEAISITNADGGTLYLSRGSYLEHEIMQNKSLGIDKGANDEVIQFAPLEICMCNIAAYSAIKQEVVNIKNVYNSGLFDFSGPRRFDNDTGYRTKSMLVFPLMNRRSAVVGVLQLVNALDEDDNVVPFDENIENVVLSMASQAAIAIENMQYMQEIRNLFESFVKVIAKTIDERTPYNSQHSENLSIHIQSFARYLTSCEDGPYKEKSFSEEDLYELKTAAWLHDIGKIVVPLETLDKSSRLADKFDQLMSRYELMIAKLHWHYYKEKAENKHKMPASEEANFHREVAYVEATRAFVTQVNDSNTYVDEARAERLKDIYQHKIKGIHEPLLTEEELEHLSIVRGTLTAKERKAIEAHVTSGARILSNMQFPEYLQHIYLWINRHHEYLDGSGYPDNLKEESIPLESRMMTILDIYDALVERNRPYKKAIPKAEALEIIKNLADENKLDTDLVKAFIDSRIWDSYL